MNASEQTAYETQIIFDPFLHINDRTTCLPSPVTVNQSDGEKTICIYYLLNKIGFVYIVAVIVF